LELKPAGPELRSRLSIITFWPAASYPVRTVPSVVNSVSQDLAAEATCKSARETASRARERRPAIVAALQLLGNELIRKGEDARLSCVGSARRCHGFILVDGALPLPVLGQGTRLVDEAWGLFF